MKIEEGSGGSNMIASGTKYDGFREQMKAEQMKAESMKIAIQKSIKQKSVGLLTSCLLALAISACKTPGICIYSGNAELEQGFAEDAQYDKCADVTVNAVELQDTKLIQAFEPMDSLIIRGSTIPDYSGLGQSGGFVFFQASRNSGAETFSTQIQAPANLEETTTSPNPNFPLEYQNSIGLDLTSNGFKEISFSADAKVSMYFGEPDLRLLSVDECHDGSRLWLVGRMHPELEIDIQCDLWSVRAHFGRRAGGGFEEDLQWLWRLPIPKPLAGSDGYVEIQIILAWERDTPPENIVDIFRDHYFWMREQGFPADGNVRYSSRVTNEDRFVITNFEGGLFVSDLGDGYFIPGPDAEESTDAGSPP